MIILKFFNSEKLKLDTYEAFYENKKIRKVLKEEKKHDDYDDVP